MQALWFSVVASVPLLVGGAAGAYLSVPRRLVAHALGFAAGALIASLAFELMAHPYRTGNRPLVLAAFTAGAALFVAVDTALDRATSSGRAVGFALLAAVTLDGVPENVALGVTLVGGGSSALLVAIVASNLPEALAGSARMRADDVTPGRCVLVWSAAALLLGGAVLLGRLLLAGASPDALALPLAFAGGAVLASLIDTLAPEALQQGGPLTALATAAGFALGTHLAVAVAAG